MTLTAWRYLICEAVRRGLEVECHPAPPPIVDAPCGVVYPGGPGRYIDGPDTDEATFCLDRVNWTLYLFLGAPYADESWILFDHFVGELHDTVDLCKSIELPATGRHLAVEPTGVAPSIDGVDAPRIVEYGGRDYLATSADLYLPVHLEGT